MQLNEIVDYLSTWTGFYFEKPVLERIATDRIGVERIAEITKGTDLTPKERDLSMADMLRYIYLTPTISPSISKKHGNFSYTIGSQTITDKRHIYEMMMRLYKRWGEEVDIDEGGLQWLE